MTNTDNVIYFPLVSYFRPDPLLFLTNALKWKIMTFTDIFMHQTGIFQILTTQYFYDPVFFLEIIWNVFEYHIIIFRIGYFAWNLT